MVAFIAQLLSQVPTGVARPHAMLAIHSLKANYIILLADTIRVLSLAAGGGRVVRAADAIWWLS